MSDPVVEEKSPATQGKLVEAMAAQLRSYWAESERYQKLLYLVGAVLLASAVFHLAVLFTTGGSWKGSVSWRKPILFGESFGLTALSIAWVMTFLPKRRVLGWVLSATMGLAMFGEVVWVSMQQWRGVPSHFNFSTPFDAAAFTLGGGGLIGITGVGIIAVTIWSFLSLRVTPSFAWAIRIGLVMLIAAQIFGQLIIQHGTAHVFDPQTGEFVIERIGSAAVFGAAGAMKLPHALSLHALQVLPLLAFLLVFTDWSEARRAQAVLLAAAGYIGVVGAGAFQTFSGRAPADLSPFAALLLGLGLASFIGAYASALLGLRHSLAHSGAEHTAA